MFVSTLRVLFLLGMVALVLLVCIVLVGFVWLLKLFLDEKTDPLRILRGLEAPFFEPLHGPVTNALPNVHNQWVQEFGHTFRFNGFGKFDYRLLTTDIRSLTHILNSAIYEKPWQTQKILSSFLGRGITLLEGAEHTRQRKIVAPAFSSSNVRRLYAPVFLEKAAELCDAWNDIVSLDGSSTIDILHWTGRATLDVIGLASFDHNFNAIKNENEDIYMAYREMFDGVNNGPSVFYLLELQFPWIEKFWSSELTQTIKKSLQVIHRFGNMVIENKRVAFFAPSDAFNSGDKKSVCNTDLLGRLVDANTDPSIPVSERLTTQELLDQINSFLFAGSDSTSLGIAWCLHFLSRYPAIQEHLRREILAAPLASTHEMHAAQIDSLPFLENVVKETLRLSPAVHSTIRVATKDDVIPLSEPLTLRDGSTTSEIQIRKGTFVHLPLEGFNTNTNVWGSDAIEFNPYRWENLPHAAKTHPGLAGLLTFSFGAHACPGWKFAILEMKIFVARVISHFVLSPAAEIVRTNIILQRPYIKDKWESGPMMPLNVSAYIP